MTRYYVLRDGVPVPEPNLRVWARWFEGSMPERVIGQDEPVPGVCVSTVFLGSDHGYGAESAPVLYETIVFDDDGTGHPLADEQWRYETKAEAVAGHADAVRAVREAALPLPFPPETRPVASAP